VTEISVAVVLVAVLLTPFALLAMEAIANIAADRPNTMRRCDGLPEGRRDLS